MRWPLIALAGSIVLFAGVTHTGHGLEFFQSADNLPVVSEQDIDAVRDRRIAANHTQETGRALMIAGFILVSGSALLSLVSACSEAVSPKQR